MKGTIEQEKIWLELEEGQNHVMIYAGAGVGKTFTIVHGATLVDGEKAFYIKLLFTVAHMNLIW